jgi:hypothetical protein
MSKLIDPELIDPGVVVVIDPDPTDPGVIVIGTKLTEAELRRWRQVQDAGRRPQRLRTVAERAAEMAYRRGYDEAASFAYEHCVERRVSDTVLSQMDEWLFRIHRWRERGLEERYTLRESPPRLFP